MAGVFRECKLTWEGKEYTFTPSMNLLRTIERGDGTGPVSLISIMQQAMSGSPQLSFMAWMVHTVMMYAGARTSEEVIYQAMMGNEAEAVQLYNAVIAAVSPSPAEEKKPEAPDE